MEGSVQGSTSHEVYTVRVWCDENGAEGEYEITDATSRVDAIERAVRGFQEHCAMTGSFYQPPRHRCQTEVLSSEASDV